MSLLMSNLIFHITKNNNVVLLSQKPCFDMTRRIAFIEASLLADSLLPDFIWLLDFHHYCELAYLLMRVPLKVF